MFFPKKRYGQHFLTDKNIARKIVQSLSYSGYANVLEIGPGKGILTEFLLKNSSVELYCVEIDRVQCSLLEKKLPQLENRLILEDVLSLDFPARFKKPVALIGSIPYNISSQILFRMLEFRSMIPEAVFMLQKEVAERICSPCGNKKYGITSVLIQAFFDARYLFTVNNTVFYPRPKVTSAVVRFVNKNATLFCDERYFFKVVKTAFNQRRKVLKNALSQLIGDTDDLPFLFKRAEQLSVDEFILLTSLIHNSLKDKS